ncbi:MAG TPA: hypothetical protein VLQ93_09505 [Myxococcaceae bacterium]|nr:hypothetical protein [Myxococcaceae bacterium]
MKQSKWGPWSMSLVVVAAAVLVTGCAATRRQAYIQEKASQYVYGKPLAEVWPQVRTLLQQKDLPLREAPGTYEIATDWHQVGAPSTLGTSFVRYLVRGREAGPARSAVEVFRQNRTVSGPGAMDSRTGQAQEIGNDTTSMQRDHELEWELLQRVDPEGAQALEAEALKAIP